MPQFLNRNDIRMTAYFSGIKRTCYNTHWKNSYTLTSTIAKAAHCRAKHPAPGNFFSYTHIKALPHLCSCSKVSSLFSYTAKNTSQRASMSTATSALPLYTNLLHERLIELNVRRSCYTHVISRAFVFERLL